MANLRLHLPDLPIAPGKRCKCNGDEDILTPCESIRPSQGFEFHFWTCVRYQVLYKGQGETAKDEEGWRELRSKPFLPLGAEKQGWW